MAARKKKIDELPSTPDPDQIREAVDLVGDPRFQDAQLEALREFEKPDAFNPREGDISQGKFERKTIREGSRIREAVIFNPTTLTAYGGSEVANAAVEDRYMGGGPGDTVVGIGSINLQQLQKTVTSFFHSHPLAKNIITCYTFLTIGEGVKVNWYETGVGRNRTNPKLAPRKQLVWNEIAEETGFQRYIRRMVKMTFLLGEWFTAIGSSDGTSKDSLRGIEPDRVTRIFYSPNDIDDVKGYEVRLSGQQRRVLMPDDVIHSRIGEIGNVPRGLPILLPVLTPLRYWQLFVENRHWINMVRARLPVIRKMKTGAAQIATEKARLATLPKPGTLAIDPESADWQFPSHNIGASDAADDGRLLSLAIAAGVNLPEFLVTADASNANYSSSLVAESPTVRMFLDYQDMFRCYITEIVKQLSGEDDGFSIEFPPVLRRGVGEMSAALATAVDRRILSRQTACEMLGRTWTGADGEEQRIAREDAEDPMSMEPDAPKNGGDLPNPFGKREDGGNGEPKTGTSMGATASSDAARART